MKQKSLHPPLAIHLGVVVALATVKRDVLLGGGGVHAGTVHFHLAAANVQLLFPVRVDSAASLNLLAAHCRTWIVQEATFSSRSSPVQLFALFAADTILSLDSHIPEPSYS